MSTVALLLVALALRLSFVLSLPPSPLYWDEPHYQHWAELYQRAWPSLFGGNEGPTLLDAFRGSLQKGEAYSASVGLVYAVAGAQPRTIFVLQAVLDTIMCLLLFGLARALGGTPAGWCALTLAALYEPLIFSTARLQTETSTALLYVGGLWAVCVPERRRAAGQFVGGVAIAVAMLARPALQFLFPLLLPAVVVRNADRAWRGRLFLVLAFAAGFFVVIGPRLVLTKALTGSALWSGELDPSADLYGGAILGNAGWKTDRLSFAIPPRDELLAVVGSGADPVRTSSARQLQADLRAATLRTWALHPLGSAAVALHKLYVAWSYPYDDSRWTFLFGTTGRALWHQLVLALALVGMPLALHRPRVAIPMLVATLYLWLTYLATKIEVRYALMPMPMMICFAGLALAALSDGWQQAWHAGRRRRLVAIATGASLGLLAAAAMSIGRLLQLLPLTPDAAHAVRVVALLAVMIGLACTVAELVGHRWRRTTTLARLAPSLAIAALVVLVGRPLAQSWREWRSTLTPNHGIARQEIVLPSGVGSPSSALLKIDLLPEGAGAYDLVVRLNGEEITRYRGGVTRGDADLPRQDYFQQVFIAQHREHAPDKAWYTIPLPPERIVPDARLVIDVALEGAPAGSGSVVLFGDYPPDASTYAGPALFSPLVAADTSLFKYLADGDFRMRRRVALAGTSRSEFSDGSTWSSSDLGFDSGRQQGRYRIFVLLEYDRGVGIL